MLPGVQQVGASQTKKSPTSATRRRDPEKRSHMSGPRERVSAARVYLQNIAAVQVVLWPLPLTVYVYVPGPPWLLSRVAQL
jgi:hypothetical protein